MNTSTNTPSPATSMSSSAFSPSRTVMPLSTPSSTGSHACEPSEFSGVERFKLNYLDGIDSSDRSITCLLAEDNPITAKIIETLFDPAWMSVCGSIGWL